MKSVTPPVPEDNSEEIGALVETLDQAEERLEQLTGGEVDSVANRTGRTILLRRAQDQLRLNESARQIAILNALPASIALLDSQGKILSVNEAWLRFGRANAAHYPGHDVGADYLKVCDKAGGDDAAEASQAAAGIRAVLDGRVSTYTLEYPCHSPAEQRWFLMTVTPLAGYTSKGAVVMHLNITASKLAENALRESEARFQRAVAGANDGIWEWIPATGEDYLSPRWKQLLGYEDHELPNVQESFFNQIHPEDRALAEEAVRAHLEERKPFTVELRLRCKGGDYRWFSSSGQAEWDDQGRPLRVSGSISDITERKKAEARIVHLNRVLFVLSSINTLIVRVKDRDELFREACEIAVDAGGFRMAMLVIVDPVTMLPVSITSAGKNEELVAEIENALSTSEGLQKTPVGQVMRESKAVISNDAQNDPGLLFGKLYPDAGVKSLAVFPLIISGEVVGVLALFAKEIDLFQKDEIKLLTELAGDIAFAIDHIDKQQQLDYLAYYDVLTGLANRRLFLERAALYIRSAASGGHKLALLLIDLERFKNINDSLGRPAGDALLRQVAEWLKHNMGGENLLARVGADHFAVLVPEVKHEGDLSKLFDKKSQAFLEHPFRLNDAVFRIAAKAGIALFPDDGAEAEILFKHAEAALKKAKASGDRYLFYMLKMSEAVAGKLTLENQLRQAIDNEEFVLHYQPKVNLVSGKVTSVEALIRWNDPRTGLVPPGRFIPILEETGLIYEVGRWALSQAIADYLRWLTTGLTAVRIAVNISPLQLRNPGFVAEIGRKIGIDAHAAAGLELEITESLIMEDVRHNIASLKAIRDLGVTIAIDDFGTGFSSLSYLARLPVDTLKIDRSFINDMTAAPEGLSLVSTIIKLAHSLKLKVVAEGVETEEQSRLLQLLSCDEMQGFLFSKPVPAEIFEARFLVPPATGSEGV